MNRSDQRNFNLDVLASILWLICGLILLAHSGQALAINVSPQSLSVQVGSNATVTVSETRGAVTVSSSAPLTAVVSYASGKATITGLSPGSATISITNQGDRKQVLVTVTPALAVSPSSVSVPVGGNVAVSVSNVSGTVTASSSNTSIATVSYAGTTATIHGISPGAATVSIADRFNTRTVSVTVTPALAVSPATVSLTAGGNAAVAVSSASGTILVSSSNISIASVTYSAGTATIHGVAAGSATISIADSFSTRTVAVTVTPGLAVSPSAVQLAAGSNATVSVTNATGTVTASSSNTSIATVVYAAGTATIRGVAAGSAMVTIADSVNSRQVVVTVSAATTLTVTPTSVTVPVGSDAAVGVSNANGAVTVSSSNTSIATVSYAAGTATIHGVAVGSASISVRDSQSTRTVSTTVVSAVAGNYTLLAWNNLGMHCFDGVDYSIFSILPPLNTLLAQLQNKNGALVTSGVNISYEAAADTRGSINSSSATKTNFWQYVQKLFGASVPPDMGLLGYPMASSTPAAMKFNTARGWYEAPGIPITNHDDTNAKNEYPMVKVVARNTVGQVLATTNVVLPVSDELACSTCHTSNVGSNAAANAARPAAGWVFDTDPLKDWKKNILRLHDEKQSGNAVYAAALQSKGYPNGLLNSANAGTPVLCVACHVSNAYQVDAGVATGSAGISSLTSALHSLHGKQIDPGNGLALDNVNNRNTCYLCHPGSVTQCLRGAMSGPATQCQSCHGNMSKVGEPTRQGWLNEPTCQACHNNSKRNPSAVDANGNPLLNIADQTFATTPNQPSTGFNLYRFSTGHGGVKCEACHGATHAEYPSLEQNDNVQSIAVQGHAGTVQECTACHQTVPVTANGGPHGMHTIGNQWVSDHHDLIGSAGGTSTCAYCHGPDFRGSPLSAVKTPKTFSVDGRSKSYAAGQQVSCYDCHNGPTSAAITGSTRLAAIPSSVGFDKLLAFNFKESFAKFNALGAKKGYHAQP